MIKQRSLERDITTISDPGNSCIDMRTVVNKSECCALYLVVRPAECRVSVKQDLGSRQDDYIPYTIYSRTANLCLLYIAVRASL